MQVTCASCMAPYEVDDSRIPQTGMKARCPKCGTSTLLHPPAQAATPAAAPASTAATPIATPLLKRPGPLKPPALKVNAPLPKPVLRSEAKATPQYASRLHADLPAVKKPMVEPNDTAATHTKLPALKVEPSPPKLRRPDPPGVSAKLQHEPPAAQASSDFDQHSDLPALKGSLPPALQGEDDPFVIDLPAPSVSDLPAPRDAAELPAPKFSLDLPVSKRDVALPVPKSSDFPSGFGSEAGPALDFSDLDAGGSEPPRGTSKPAGTPSFGVPAFGDGDVFEDVTSSAGPDLALALKRSASPNAGEDVEPDFGSSQDQDAFAELFGSPSPPSAAPAQNSELEFDADELDLDEKQPGGGELGFGEVDLGVGEDHEAMEFADIPEEPMGAHVGPGMPDAGVVGDLDAPASQVEQVRKPSYIGLYVTVGLLLVLAGAGFALGFTRYGYFGIYVFEQYFPAAGDKATAQRIIRKAEGRMVSDTYADRRETLRILAQGRRKIGLNRELLSRSLLHEAMFQLRFGSDPAGIMRMNSISARLEARHWDAPNTELACAAREAAAGAYDKAASHLGQARAQAGGDFVAALLAAELALQAGRVKDAERDFQSAQRLGGKVSAQWGLARVYIKSQQSDKAQLVLDTILSVSPHHSAAQMIQAQLAWNDGSPQALAKATLLAEQVAGLRPVKGAKLVASKLERAAALSLLGRLHERAGRMGEATQAFTKALALEPARSETLLGAGRMLLRDKRPGDALARFEAVINAAANSQDAPVSAGALIPATRPIVVDAKLGAAKAMLMLERQKMAKELLEPLLKEFPEDAEVLLWLGKTEQELDHLEIAEKHLLDAMRLAPNEFDAYLALSQLYVDSNRPEEASKVLRQAEGQVKDTAERRRMLGRSELARGNTDAALGLFRAALELEPNNLAALFDLAVGLRHAGKLDEAKARFDEVEKLDPAYPELALERGRIYEARGEWEVAARSYRLALEKAPKDSALLLRLGACQVEAGHTDAAEATLKKVAELNPNSADLSYLLGRVDFARGRFNEALSNFQRSTALDDEQGEVQMYAGWAALELGTLGQALEFVNQAIKLDPSLGDAYWVRGRIKLRAGAVKDARDDFERALKLKPSRYETYAVLGDAYDQLRQVKLAIDAYNKALSYDKERGDWWFRLGALFMDAGQPQEAQRALSQATAIGDPQKPVPPWLPEAHRVYAEALTLQGRQSEALRHYQRYLDIAPATALDRQDVESIVKAYGGGDND